MARSKRKRKSKKRKKFVRKIGRAALSVGKSFAPAPVRGALSLVQSSGKKSSPGKRGRNSESSVAADILADSQGFINYVRNRGELSAIPLIMSFISSGGASLPGMVAKLWGEYLADKARGGFNPSIPTLGPMSGGGGGVAGGGSGGLLNDPFLALQMPITMAPQAKVINSAPKGYVLVDHPISGEKIAVLKPIARRLRLWKPRAKPPISASEYRTLKTADRVRNKVKKMAGTADFVVRNRK